MPNNPSLAGLGPPEIQYPPPGPNPLEAAGRVENPPVPSGELDDIAPLVGLNWMEEQYLKYGHNLGNYHPVPIIGTDSMASVYKTDNMTPDEYTKFFNWRHPRAHGDDRKQMQRYRPKGLSYKLHGDRFHQTSVLEDKERLVEFTRNHGTTSANAIRNQRNRGIQQGNWSNTFPCEG